MHRYKNGENIEVSKEESQVLGILQRLQVDNNNIDNTNIDNTNTDNTNTVN